MLGERWSMEGKVVLVAGGGRGVGRGIAEVLAEAGADVAINALTPKYVEEAATSIAARTGRRLIAVPGDMTHMESVEAVVGEVLSQLGRIDVLVNALGEGYWEPLVQLPGSDKEGMTDDRLRFIMDLNLNGTIMTTRAVGPHLLEQQSGKVINISSHAARRGGDGVITTTAKTALEGFTRALALEWAPFGIQVNGIGPGIFPNPLSHPPEMLEPVTDWLLERIPLKRFGELHELGDLALYLASGASDYMTGQMIYLDGGWTL